MTSLKTSGKRGLKQRGVVLLFSLITLVILLIAAVALIRSFSNSMFTAGNIAFKRDLQNQSDRVIPGVLASFNTGVLATTTARAASLVASNYSAMQLPSNSLGVPLVLLGNDTAFSAVGNTANDVSVTTIAGEAQQVTIRYVIDRLCDATGTDTTLGAGHCVLIDSGVPQGGSVTDLQRAETAGVGGGGAVPQQLVYRISVRVTGPRNTQAFFQTTFGD
jgi:type IV pilus assembly protein PilX